MSKLHELSWRTNINTYTFRGKHIVLYDDHRTLLNILFEAKKLGEFAEKYLRKGTKVVVTGRIQTGSYTNKDGQKVYTTDVVVEECEFAESKNAAGDNSGFTPSDRPSPSSAAGDGFMNIPDGIDEELPFN